MLAFHNIGAEGAFVGALSDPMPVQWHGDILTIARTPNAAADSVHTGPALDAEVTTST